MDDMSAAKKKDNNSHIYCATVNLPMLLSFILIGETI